jgi:hypothetical protein
MNRKQRLRFERGGWVVGDAIDLFGLTIAADGSLRAQPPPPTCKRSIAGTSHPSKGALHRGQRTR